MTEIFQTRIQLKYDSYENWTSKNPILLKGEIAVTIVPADAANTGLISLPCVIIKVGDGTSNYNDLDFVSALASDVPEWAKSENKPTYAIEEISGSLEYQIVEIDADNYQYQLQARKFGSEDIWKKVSDLDLSSISSRITDLETWKNSFVATTKEEIQSLFA